MSRNKFDVWLNRTHQLAQIGLLLFAVFGFFYTVLPLYEKAVLDEEISRAKIELRDARKSLKTAYIRTRSFAVVQISHVAGAECSGLPTPLRPHNAQNDDQKEHDLDPLGIDPRSCLVNETRVKISNSELTDRDKKFLSEEIFRIADALELHRRTALKDFKSFPVRATADTKLLPPPPPFGPHINQIFKMDETKRLQLELKIRINIGQRLIATQYGQRVRDEILKLRYLDWREKENE